MILDKIKDLYKRRASHQGNITTLQVYYEDILTRGLNTPQVQGRLFYLTLLLCCLGREIQGFHIIQVNNLEEQYKKELRNERATAQEKLGMMQGYLFVSCLHLYWNFSTQSCFTKEIRNR